MSLSGAAISRRVRGRISLYDYSINAVLPALPLLSDEWLPMRGSYPNFLTFDTTLARPIIEIGRFTDSYFSTNINAWKEPLRLCSRTPLPSEIYASLTSLLSVPCLPSCNGSTSSPGSHYPPRAQIMLAEPPSTLLGVAEWVYRYPLRTVEAICNLADFGYRRWEFLPSLFEEISNGLFYCFTLAERPEQSTSQSQWQNQMTVFVIPPWLMSLDDFRDFVNVEMIRDFRTSASLLEKYGGEACYPTLLESIWVLIFDYCERREVQSYALTSYNQWVFGGFTYDDEKCYARISSLRTCTSREPTIVQTLLFFIRNVEMRDIGLSSQWSSISHRTDLTIRREREEHFKRKSDFDLAHEGPNKRRSVLSSHSSSSSYTGEIEQSYPAARYQHSSRSVSYHGSQNSVQQSSYSAHCPSNPIVRSLSSAGSGSHRRRRKRASSIVRPSHPRSSFISEALSSQSSAAAVQRAFEEGDRAPTPQFSGASYVNSRALSCVERHRISESPASTSTSSSLSGARPKQLDPSSLCDPNVDEDSPNSLDSSSDSSMLGEDHPEEGEVNHVIASDDEDEESLQPKPFRSDSPSRSDVRWSIRTPQPRSPHTFPPNMVKRRMEDMEAIRGWYGHTQPQTPSTPTRRRFAIYRTQHTDPSLVPISTSPQHENELQLYEENSGASLTQWIDERRIMMDGNPNAPRERASSTPRFDALMEQTAVVREDPIYRFLRYTDVPMSADLRRDAGMGPLEYMQWNDMRQRGVEDTREEDVSNSGVESLATHFRAVQPAIPAVFPIQDVVTTFDGHPWLDPNADPLEAAVWAATVIGRMQEDGVGEFDHFGQVPYANASELEPASPSSWDRSDCAESTTPLPDTRDGEQELVLSSMDGSDAESSSNHGSLFYVRSPHPEERARSVSEGSGAASTLWEGEHDRSVAATVIDPEERPSPLISPVASPDHAVSTPALPAGPGSILDTQSRADPASRDELHPDPYQREYTPAPISEVFSFKSDFTTTSQLQEMRGEFMAMEHQLNEWRKNLPEDRDPTAWWVEEDLLAHMPAVVPRARRAVRGEAPEPSPCTSPGRPSDMLACEAGEIESVSPSMVSTPGAYIPSLPELELPLTHKS